MDYKVLYRKYRPDNFNAIIGQDHIKKILINSIKLNKIAHAYIFTGPRGTGKTSTAKIFAKTLNCLNNSSGISCEECINCKTFNESPDIIEIDAASNNGVEEIRTLRDSVKVSPYSSKYKIYIIDEVHMLSNSAWNALLKTLEEPPSHVIFILATTEINKIPITVMSRCQRFDFSKIDNQLINSHMLKICNKENINIEDDALYEVVKLSNGCLRDALSYLDKISKYDGKISLNDIEDNFGIVTEKKLNELYFSLINNNKEAINNVLDDVILSGITPLSFINNFVDYLLTKIIENKDSVNNSSIKKIIFNLSNIIQYFNSTVNPFTLIKVELLSTEYFPGNKIVENISQNDNLALEKINKDTCVNKSIEKKSETNNNDFNDNLKHIRINNSFVDASKENKKIFQESWNKFINILDEQNEFMILGYLDNIVINVVSKTNVLFSFKNISDAIVFNNNLNFIEDKFNNIFSSKYKFIALSEIEWDEEKEEFIKNKDKNYLYIDEDKVIKNSNIKSMNLAEDIFGNDIIEIG